MNSRKASEENTTVESQDEQVSGWLLVNTRVMVGLVGVVACHAWLFALLGTSAFIPEGASHSVASGAHVSFVLGIAAALLLSWALSDRISAYKTTQTAVSFVCFVAGCVGVVVLGGSSALLWIPCAVLGCGSGLLYALYGEFVCKFFRGYIEPYVQGIFACAAFACIILVVVGPSVGFVIAAVFASVAFLAYGFVLAIFKLGEEPVVSAKESDSRNKVVWRSYLATTTSGMAAGYALGCILSTRVSGDWTHLITALAVVATCSALLFDVLKTHITNETNTMRLFLPLSAIVVFPLIFIPDDFKFLFALLLLCGSLVPTTCSISAMCRHIIICDLAPIRAFAFGRLMSFAGIALGMILSFIGFSPLVQQMFGSVVIAVSVVAFMMLVVFSASFVMTEDNYPSKDRLITVGDGEDDALSVAPGTPIRKLAASESSHEDETDRASESVNEFDAKCDVVAARFGLSRRQREVLDMLARGRNAEYVAEKLVVSPHTAKAHIYNIYQKTGVHSRQELMDLVEDADIESSDNASAS